MNDQVAIGYMMRARSGEHRLDAAALLAAQERQGNATQKLSTYMACHHDAVTLQTAWRRMSRMWRLWLWGMIGAAVALGSIAALSAFEGAASVSLAADQVNVFWLLSALLGIHCLTLIIWLVFLCRPPGNAISLASLASKAIQALTAKQPSLGLAAETYASLHLNGALGKWSISVVSHGFWAVYLFAGLAASVVLLSIKSYVFVWETTLLAADSAVALVTVLGRPLAALGVSVPGETAIIAAQSINTAATGAQDAQIWAQFCLAALAVYGVLARVVLFAISAVLARRASRSLDMTPSDPFFAGLLAQIYQPSARADVVDADIASRPKRTQASPPLTALDPIISGPLMGWEVEQTSMPTGDGLTSVGVFDRAEDLAEALRLYAAEPVTLVISLLNTPDRGVAAALAPFKSVAAQQKQAWLADMEALRARSSQMDLERRVADWWSLFSQLGFEPSSIHSDTARQHDPS